MNQILTRYFILDYNSRHFLYYFASGFILYSLFYALTAKSHVNFVVIQSFQTVGIGLMMVGVINSVKHRLETSYVDLVFKIYLFWLITVILRGFTTDYELVKKLLFDAWYGLFVFISPLILLFPKNLEFYRKTFDFILISAILCIILYLYFINELIKPDFRDLTSQGLIETISKTLGIPAGFILLTYMYQSKSKKIIAWLVILLTLFFAILRARRGLIFMALSVVIATYILYLVNLRVKIIFILISVLIGSFLINYTINSFNNKDIFHSLRLRGLEDTRSGVEKMFYRDMSTFEWLAGKGMTGEYYCPGIDSGNKSGYRFVIETDYLNIILKGGIIGLVLFLLLAIPAIIKGLFFSSNNLSKAAAIWIILALINMYPSAVNTFTLNYLLVWISIGICHTPAIRTMPEHLVRNFLLIGNTDALVSHLKQKKSI